MLNVNALQKTLSAMPLPELQQYAALHKNDPYVVAMALSVANTKKEAMTAQQGMAGRQPMPKVVDQDIAAISPRIAALQQAPAQGAAPQLPEEQGIGALPAPNMAAIGKAAGGIIAFDEGGEVPRYQVGGTPSSSTPYAIPGMTQSDLYARAKAKYEANQPLTSTEKALLFSAAPLAAAGDALMSPVNAVRKLVRNPLDTSPEPSMTPLLDARARALYGDDSLQPTSASLGRSPSNAEIERQYLGGAAPAVQGGQKTVGGMTADQAVAAARQNNANTNTAFTPEDEAAIRRRFAGAEADPTKTAGNTAAPTAPGIAAIQTPGVNSVMANVEKILGPREKVPDQKTIESQLEERQKPYFEKLDKKMSEQKDKLGSDREEAMYMAMIKGGFAAAAGTSPYALANIAKGGEAGIADLSESFKELRKAAQEQSKMEMELEKARMDASTNNLKSAWERQDKAKELGQKRDSLVANAYVSITDAITRAGATVEAAKISSTGEQRTLEALGAADANSPLRKGFELKQELLKRTTLAETWAKLAYPSGNMGQPNEAFLQRFPTPETYVQEALSRDQQGAGGGAGGAGGAGGTPVIRPR